MEADSPHFLFFTYIIYIFAYMKQLKIPFEFIDNSNEICLYKIDDWVLINKKKNDPIKLKASKGCHMYAVNIVSKEIFDNSSVETKILPYDKINSKKLSIRDYIMLSNTIKSNKLILNKKKGTIINFSENKNMK